MKLSLLELITFYFLKFFSLFICQFSRKVSILFGIVLGDFIRILIPVRKKVAIQNLKVAFPEKSKHEIDSIIKKCYRHFGIVLMDLFRMAKYNKKNLKLITSFNNKDIQKLKNNKGGLIITGHIGNWEMFLPLFGVNEIPFSVVAQFQRNKGVQNFFNELREMYGSKIILKGSSSRELINEIQNGRFLGLASDQNAGKKGLMVPFFNKNTSLPKGGAVFYLKTKSPMFFCYCVADENYNYKMIVKEFLLGNYDSKSENKVEDICKLISLDLEEIVSEYPEQYFWFHRKWPKKIYKN